MFPLAGWAVLTEVILTSTLALGKFRATLLFAEDLEGTTLTMPLAIYLGFETKIKIVLVFGPAPGCLRGLPAPAPQAGNAKLTETGSLFFLQGPPGR